MSKIEWDAIGQRYYETGVDHGILSVVDESGKYTTPVPWNGLVNVSENPSGAEASAQYADNIKYLNLISTEDFGLGIEAFYYPPTFGECDGTKEAVPGVIISQQARKTFGFGYRTRMGNDTQNDSYGYKLHFAYGCSASPSEKGYGTVSDSPEAITFSWDVSTTPVDVGIEGFRPTALVTVDSTKCDKEKLKELEDKIYGTEDQEPEFLLPGDIIKLLTAG